MTNIADVLSRGVTNIIPSKKKLLRKLKSGKKLNIYLGIDPTATKLHLGNAVALRKLQAFAELGHNVTFLIGDFTALVGDTSDKTSERPILSSKEILKNFNTYKKQAEKIIDFSKIKVKHNSGWLKKLTLTEIVKLTQNFSLGDFIGRELIRERLKNGKRVRFDETLYPVMQGYDSYFMDTDIQIGGADQTFNMQAGRTLQKKLRKKESYVLVTGYLEGTDGRKMSKSWGNAVWIEDKPNDMFGKIMSIKDDLIINYLILATNLPMKSIHDEENSLKKGENPMSTKRRLAYQVVKELHSNEQAQLAQEHFDKTFQQKNPKYEVLVSNQGTLAGTVASASGASISQAKRLIRDGAVDLNGQTIMDPAHTTEGGGDLKVGKKSFYKVKKK